MTNITQDSLMPHHRLRAYGVAVRAARIRDRVLREQALRAAKSVCLNCAEGAGRVTRADKARSNTVARGELVEAVQLVHEDLCWRGKKRVDPSQGRHGMAAEQVLRAAVLEQMSRFSYEQLAFHLANSATYRTFCRLGFDRRPPKKATLQKNIKRVKLGTWQAINEMLVLKAQQLGVEDGKKMRTDCTVVESNIHHPNDSSLLWDSVRVLARLMARAREDFGIAFHDHRRRAKRRALGINNAKNMQQRRSLYRDLLKVTKKTISQAESTLRQLAEVVADGPVQTARLTALSTELGHYLELAQRVIYQTERRVLDDENVPASEKVVSIFEPHTDIIIKDNRDTLYGHKLTLTSGASGLVTYAVAEQGNPAEASALSRK